MTRFTTLRLSTDARGIATLTLDRPHKHNAMDARMIAELTEAAAALGADPSVRAVVLAAAGPTFCAGGDLGWMRDQLDADLTGKTRAARALHAMLAALDGLPKPLIGRIQGNAYGGGLGLIAVCDLAIAAEGVRFALTETRLGLIPATIGPFVLRKTGAGMARQVFFSGADFGTDFALRAGLVYEVCASGDLDSRIEAAARASLGTMPGAVARAKRFCRDPEALSPGGAELAIAALAACWEGDEARTRIAAFLEGGQKPPPMR